MAVRGRIAEASRTRSSFSARLERVSGRVSARMASLPAAAKVDRSTRRRAGAFRRALCRAATRIRDPKRLFIIVLLGVLAGVMLSCLIARAEPAGAVARDSWAAGRLWVNGGDPYHP